MEKIFNWRTALTEHINAKRDVPYDWKTHNCCFWVASCIEVMTGEDFSFGQGEVTDADTAEAVLRSRAPSVLALCTSLLGKKDHISSARAGDVVVMNTGKRGPFARTIGICNGAQSFFVGEEGLEMVPTLSLEACFHV